MGDDHGDGEVPFGRSCLTPGGRGGGTPDGDPTGERGRALGAEAGGKDMTAFLEELGFEPGTEGDGRTVLHNCPFHPVAAQAPELVCGMNHAFLCGYLAARGDQETTAVLALRGGLLRRTADRSGSHRQRAPAAGRGRPPHP